MALAQRVTAEETFQLVPPVIAAAAAAYQRAHAAELEQLTLMGQQDLSIEWTEHVRSTVLTARRRIHEAHEARVRFRDQVREFVAALRAAGEPTSSVLRYIRSMIQLLESTGAVVPDGRRLESEVFAWALEDCESR